MMSHWEKLELVKECLMYRLTRSPEAGRRILQLKELHNLTENEVAEIFQRDMMTYWKPVVETVGEEVVEGMQDEPARIDV
jgi:hypothetical protein